MALTNETQFYQWLSNVVDALNYNIQKIGDALAITDQLSFLDPPPITGNDDILAIIKEGISKQNETRSA